MPGSLMVRNVIVNASGPFFEPTPTGTMYEASSSIGAFAWFASSQPSRSRPTSSQI